MTASDRQRSGVRLTARGLLLNGETKPMIAGEIHYFQHEPRHWPRLLDSCVELGLNLISTYVPWGVHEAARRNLDFGERRRSRDVTRFLDLAKERELLVSIRPGPHINAELTWLGYPRWLLELPEVQARTPQGNPLWLPRWTRLGHPPFSSARRTRARRWCCAQTPSTSGLAATWWRRCVPRPMVATWNWPTQAGTRSPSCRNSPAFEPDSLAQE